MDEGKSIEIFKGTNGERVAEIVQADNGKYQLWKIERRDFSPPGTKHSLVNEYQDLEAARAEAQMIVVRHEQDQKRG